MLNSELSVLKSIITEDIGNGDLSIRALPNQIITANFISKSEGILAGNNVATEIYNLFSTEISYRPLVQDSEVIHAGQIYAQVTGPAHELLSSERVILNLMQRMSGIATATKLAIKTLNDSTIKILDTRKTAPGLRIFDKQAVQIGGGLNHRFGLYDAVMLKDNHWKLINDLASTIHQLRAKIGPTKIIEIEVETIDELHAAINSEVDIIMFDNQNPDTIKQWRKLVPSSIKVEVSGGINLKNIAQYAKTGINFISLGYLTNSVRPLDLSLEFN